VVSIYERLGEPSGRCAAADGSSDRVLADLQPPACFAGVEPSRTRAYRAGLPVRGTGGPGQHTGRRPAMTHDDLDVTLQAFDRVVGYRVAHRDEIATAEHPAA
jgi:hypothetical protein